MLPSAINQSDQDGDDQSSSGIEQINVDREYARRTLCERGEIFQPEEDSSADDIANETVVDDGIERIL